MTFSLLVLGYATAPLLVGFLLWRRGRGPAAMGWVLGCALGPLLVYVVAALALTHWATTADGGAGEALGIFIVSAFLAAFAWLVLGGMGLISALRRSKTSAQGEA